jgi:TolA-binding protein
MVGRNDPCVCGSGKKYKKCCGKSQVIDMTAVIDEELERVIEGYANDGLGPREYGAMETRFRNWMSVLRDTFDKDLIETLAFETYMYVERKDLWVEYLSRQMGKHHRGQVLDVLQSWKNPFWLMGEVIDRKEKILYLRDGVSGDVYTIDSEETPIRGDWLFGVVMPDFRDGDQGLQDTSGLLFIPKRRKEMVQALIQKLKAFDGDALGMYRLFGELKQEDMFSPFEEEVLRLVTEYMKAFDLEADAMIMMTEAFLLNVEVKAKKPGAVAAGLVQAAEDFRINEMSYLTQKQLVEYFEVSIGTMNKYRDIASDFIITTLKAADERSFDTMVEIGTDPRGTERHLWEMVMRTSRMESASNEDINSMIQGQMNEKFEPVGNKEHAQQLCYEAYEATSEKERVRLSRKAESLDPKNTDVQLLLAEQEANDIQKEIHFLEAISTGYRQFDTSFGDEAWMYVVNRPLLRAQFAYGAWLMKKGKLDKAIQQFQDILEMNPKDQQGAKWLLVSAYLRVGRLQEAEGILVQQDPFHQETMFHYLNSMIEILEGDVDSGRIKALNDKGIRMNPLVAVLLYEGKDPGEFPRKLTLEAGNEDEARLVYWLIYGLI